MRCRYVSHSPYPVVAVAKAQDKISRPPSFNPEAAEDSNADSQSMDYPSAMADYPDLDEAGCLHLFCFFAFLLHLCGYVYTGDVFFSILSYLCLCLCVCVCVSMSVCVCVVMRKGHVRVIVSPSRSRATSLRTDPVTPDANSAGPVKGVPPPLPARDSGPILKPHNSFIDAGKSDFVAHVHALLVIWRFAGVFSNAMVQSFGHTSRSCDPREQTKRVPPA